MNHLTTKAVHLIRPSSRLLETRIGFKSIYSLDKLYPNSAYDFSSRLEQQAKEAAEKNAAFHGFIPMDQVNVKVSRSSGAGGQNVNKVNTKVEVRFKVDAVTFIPPHLKKLLREKWNTRITKEGYFYVDSEKTRSQTYNLADCLDKIRFMVRGLEKSAEPPVPEDPEVVAARIRRAASARLRQKREQSYKKQARQDDGDSS